MRSDVKHELIGYDPSTDRVAYREKIPSRYDEGVLSMVRPDADDPDATGSYAVDLATANDICGAASLPKGPQGLNYFVESLAQPAIWEPLRSIF